MDKKCTFLYIAFDRLVAPDGVLKGSLVNLKNIFVIESVVLESIFIFISMTKMKCLI